MNRSSDIIQYLSGADSPRSVLMAPNAPPVSHVTGSVAVALPFIMDAADIQDTLKALTLNAPDAASVESSTSGTFSFSLPKVGRIRIQFGTQRGTKMVRVNLIPFATPRIEDVCDEVDEATKLVAFLSDRQSGLLTVSCTMPDLLNRFTYALIQAVNTSGSHVIFMVEHSIPYLLAHGESIVIQSEMNGDITSLEQGLESVLGFEPSLLYVGDIRSHDAIPSIRHPIGSGVKTVLSSSSMTGDALVAHIGLTTPFRTADGKPIPHRAITLTMTPSNKASFTTQWGSA